MEVVGIAFYHIVVVYAYTQLGRVPASPIVLGSLNINFRFVYISPVISTVMLQVTQLHSTPTHSHVIPTSLRCFFLLKAYPDSILGQPFQLGFFVPIKPDIQLKYRRSHNLPSPHTSIEQKTQSPSQHRDPETRPRSRVLRQLVVRHLQIHPRSSRYPILRKVDIQSDRKKLLGLQ